jgi:hypothetical protein
MLMYTIACINFDAYFRDLFERIAAIHESDGPMPNFRYPDYVRSLDFAYLDIDASITGDHPLLGIVAYLPRFDPDAICRFFRFSTNVCIAGRRSAQSVKMNSRSLGIRLNYPMLIAPVDDEYALLILYRWRLQADFW